MTWKCDCGRTNDSKQAWCFICGTANPTVPDQESAEEILLDASIRLTETYRIPIHLKRLGGMGEMTVAEAREMVAETERDILASLDEYKYA